MFKKLIPVCFSVYLFACNNTSPGSPQTTVKEEIKPSKSEVKIAVATDTFYNPISHLIAGKDSLINYKVTRWDSSNIRKKAVELADKYEKMKVERLKKIELWNKNNLATLQQPDSAFAFYPFSGGDFIHLQWLYPNATEYFMVAQEKVGDFPDLFKKDAPFVNEYLENVDYVLRDIYYKSYFITKNMIEDINSTSRVSGMFPVILWAMAKTDHEILQVKFSVLDSLGNTNFKNRGELKKQRADLVEVLFKHKSSSKIKKLTYLSADISDAGFTKSKRYLNYLQSKIPKKCNSFIKSASYLLHYKSFAKIRDFIFEKSDYIVQDDTGIPFKYIDQTKWKINLFGVYEKPVDDFDSSRVFQNDLNDAYNNPSFYKGKLDFSLGYHWGTKKQNQIVLKRTAN
jgi:hypothetical protein